LGAVVNSSFSVSVHKWMPTVFAVWLLITAVGPHQDLYKAYFHALVIPLILILLVSGDSRIEWKDPFLLAAMGLIAYTGISTLFVGNGPLDNHIEALRWSIEASFVVMALFIWMPDLVRRPYFWGRLLLLCALLGAAGGILYYLVFMPANDRLEGYGALYHTIRAGSVLLAYLALGFLILTFSGRTLTVKDHALAGAALVFVVAAVLLTKSRGPILAMLIYLLFLVGLGVTDRRYRVFSLAALIVVSLVAVVSAWYLGVGQYLEGLFDRGTSKRLIIWEALLRYPPESLLFGVGAGTELEHTPAQQAWNQLGTTYGHPHNLLLGTYYMNGLIGFGLLCLLLGLVIHRIMKVGTWRRVLLLLSIPGLVGMLTFTSSYTLVSSAKAIWLFGWLPLVWVWWQATVFQKKDADDFLNINHE